MKRICGARAAGGGAVTGGAARTGVLVAPRGAGACVVDIDDEVRDAPFAVRQGTRHRGHRHGVTNSTINIAYGDDRGFSGRPGPRPGDGRRRQGHDQPGATPRGVSTGARSSVTTTTPPSLNVRTRDDQACKTDFMLVGEGFALDGLAEQTRLGCNLAAVPGFTVAPVVANAYEMYQASPNPANYSPVSAAYQAETLFGSKTQHAGEYNSTLSTQAAVDGQGRPGLHRGRLEVRQLPVRDQLQRRAELHAVRAEAPELRRPDRLQRLHPGPDPLRRPRGGEPDRLRPDLGRGRRPPTPRRSPSGTPPGWPTTSTSGSPTSRSRRPRSSRPSPSTSRS